LYTIVEAISNNHEGAIEGDCNSSWVFELPLTVAMLTELAHQRSSADVADLDAMSKPFSSNEPVRMSTYESCTNGMAELRVAISFRSI
jgi:hypothetical protein